jgi:hypothetical protein
MQLGEAYARADAGRFAVGTGVVERAWAVTPGGAATVRLVRRGGRRWARKAGFGCDWALRDIVGDAPGELDPLRYVAGFSNQIADGGGGGVSQGGGG